MDFFTMSEFAQLRQININSLRYYEKLGILRPAVTDKNNRYRYYSAEQLTQLDFILMSIDLGVTLKELPQFLDEDGSFQVRQLMEYGYAKQEKKLCQLKKQLERTSEVFQYLDKNKAFINTKGLYRKNISARQILTVPTLEWKIYSKKMEQSIAEIYTLAKKANLLTVLPVGLLIEYSGGHRDCYLFQGVVGDGTGIDNVSVLPESESLCVQLDFHEEMDIFAEINHWFGTIDKGRIIVENMYFDCNPVGKTHIEIQKPET